MENWFNVDKEGLAKLLEKRGKKFAIAELISNAWDQNVKEVKALLSPVAGHRALYELVVEDDDPEGFKDLSHAFTLFAESTKKGDANKRGRFNIGEKLVLAVCDSATISSTKGAVKFDGNGRHMLRTKRAAGSEFRGMIRMVKAEHDETVEFIRTLIPPATATTTFNGTALQTRLPKATFEASLLTEVADADGFLRRTTRKTSVRVYEPLPDETPSLYEMGIPVVETNDKWHIDIDQKVPLNMDRDNVPPAYLRTLRAMVMNELFKEVKGDEISETWVQAATEAPEARPEAVEHVLTEKFGEKRVIFDPSDLEANKLAVSQGYTVIAPRSLSPGQWSHVRDNRLALPAGQVTPSPKAEFKMALDKDPSKFIPPEKWTPGIGNTVNYAKDLAEGLGIGRISVRVLNDPTASYAACYGSRELIFNVGRLGYRWFDGGVTEAVNSLLIHEFGHHYCSDHLAHEFHKSLCDLGAKLAQLVYRKPDLFRAYEITEA